jgi:hypothetical protein
MNSFPLFPPNHEIITQQPTIPLISLHRNSKQRPSKTTQHRSGPPKNHADKSTMTNTITTFYTRYKPHLHLTSTSDSKSQAPSSIVLSIHSFSVYPYSVSPPRKTSSHCVTLPAAPPRPLSPPALSHSLCHNCLRAPKWRLPSLRCRLRCWLLIARAALMTILLVCGIFLNFDSFGALRSGYSAVLGKICFIGDVACECSGGRSYSIRDGF